MNQARAMATSVKSVSEEQRPVAPARTVDWTSIAFFGALLILCYFPVLKLLVWQWTWDEDMGHGFFVPIVAGWIAWQQRDKLTGIAAKPNYWGVALLLWGIVQMILGSLGAELFLARTAFLISLVGAILLLRGAATVRALAFPLVLLLFMIPIPKVIYGQITLPLQLFASTVASNVLTMIGIPVLQTGNILELPNGMELSVVEACSGIRSLLSLSFLSLVYAWFFDPKPWMKWVLLVATIPIAIFANAARVTVTGILGANRPELAQGFFHSLEGWVLFTIAMVILVVCHRLVNQVYGMWRKAKEAGPLNA